MSYGRILNIIIYNKIGRGRGIRTPDTLLPKQVRYQAALYPDLNCDNACVKRGRNHTYLILRSQPLFQLSHQLSMNCPPIGQLFSERMKNED